VTDTEFIRQQVLELITRQKLGVLSTYGDGQPFASLVAIAGTEDLKHLIFATPKSTRKFNNILMHPKVAVLVNSSTNRVADIQEAAAVTVTGKAVEVMDSSSRKAFADIFVDKHPHLKAFIAEPATALVCVIADTYYLVKQFQNVMTLQIT
jgi:nitroimidazol reductase NimA-like FMN-containing flavoprotein (pyridoxamine 5'-phosphate oxidase superfamily)